MAKNAIIQIKHLQYNVEEGREYTVPKFAAEEGSNIDISEVLMVSDGKKTEVGKPFVKNSIVTLEVLKQDKGEKVVSRVYKAKSRYRRTKGIRKQVTTFKVVSIK